ncbi:single-pass membrane protein with aspartate-rich tail 1b [Carcharodon carcharias]|uniref:single-pass membrane protein with aspartate-rich tail 1b n=1 Tax=Carcharodon carcharias TaxID=13397 RepID=UPI001B7D9324|nr:single-pass membrane protein with aspartate-rich tail 1b [Carcharodon carcharias]
MAAVGWRVFGLGRSLSTEVTRGLLNPRTKAGIQLNSFRNVVMTKSGAILPRPVKTSFGLMKVFVVVVPFLYMGTQISKSFASLLEEHDIFVPVDDDDDD